MRRLTEAEIATLREMASYQRYHFRQATCRNLVALGLAVPLRPDLKRGPHCITKEGRAALAQSDDASRKREG